MKALFWLSLGLCWPAFAWAADSVEVRIAVVLAKEKAPEGPLPPEAFSEESRREHKRKGGREGKREKCEEHADCKEKRRSEADALDSEDLRPMQKALGLRRHYGWLKRFSKQRVTVDDKGQAIALPGGAKALVRLQGLKDGVATLVVTLPNTETVFQLGRAGSLYLQAGKHEDKEVWVVISPKKQFR
jgi:hypothetical protein